MSSKILKFYMELEGLDSKKSLEKYLLFTLSPVIAGEKPSSTITFSYKKKEYEIWEEYKEEFLKTLNLKYITLRKGEKAEIILIYNEKALDKCLRKKENKVFLKKLGYDIEEKIEENIYILMERYNKYHCPHELGVFLGIPIEDVIDFMECSNKKCLMCGYWKVFNNYEEARDIFKRYDNSKEHMISSILEKKTLTDILENFKEKIAA